MLVVDELDIAGGVLKIACIDYLLLGDRGIYPLGQLADAVSKRRMVGHG